MLFTTFEILLIEFSLLFTILFKFFKFSNSFYSNGRMKSWMENLLIIKTKTTQLFKDSNKIYNRFFFVIFDEK